MTTLGKILVLLNLGLSWLFAAWALGLYTHRIEWAPRPREAGAKAAEPSKIEELSSQIKRAYEIQQPLEARYQANLAALARLEGQRTQARGWYADQLHIVREGKNRKGDDTPIQELTVKDGQLVQDPAGRQALMIDNKPALSLNGYLKKIGDLQKDVDTEQKAIAELIKKFDELTGQIGDLQKKIEKQELLLDRQKAEVKSLTPMWLNFAAEGELLKKRTASLESRVQELEKLPATTERQ